MPEQFLPFEEGELEELLNYNKQVKLSRPKDVYGLTPKEKLFCDLLLQGKTACKAYRTAFNCTTDNFNTVYSSSYKLKEKPKIKYYLDIKRKQLAEKADITAQEIIANLAAIARKAYKDSDRIKANEVLAKIKNLFDDGAKFNFADAVFVFGRSFDAQEKDKRKDTETSSV